MQVISIACCVFYSHCGNRAITREKHFDRRNSNWFSFPLWNKQDRNIWISKFLKMHEWKDQICSSWFAPVGSASDYPLFSKWVIYGEVHWTFSSFLMILCISFSFINFWVYYFCCLFSTVSLQWIVSSSFRWNFAFIFIVGNVYRTLHR